MSSDTTDQEAEKAIAKVLIGIALAIVIFVVLMGVWRRLHVPNNLYKARLEGHAWNSDEVNFARMVTYKQLSSLAAALDDADRKGDLALIWEIMPESSRVLQAWNDQSDDVKKLGHDCILSALHVSNGLGTVAAGGGWARAKFDAALHDCKP
jgi:hypothetical protein